MRNIAALVALSILLLVLSCKKSPELATENIPVFNEPVKFTVSFKNISFSAGYENLNPGNSEECGFEWSKKSGGVANVITVGKISVDSFSVQIETNLEENIEYQVRAWVETGSKKFYSNPTYFFGTVALKPEILSLNRNYALWGDTIRVKIRNLPQDVLPQDINVKIESGGNKCIYADSTEIAFLMPFSTTPGKLDIRILVNNQSCANTAEIENAFPQVTSVSKQLISYADTVILYGKFWPEYAARVFPGSKLWSWVNFDIISYTNDKVVIKIPDGELCNSKFDINFLMSSLQGEYNYISSYPDFILIRTGNWKTLNPALPTNRVLSVSVNGEAYVLDLSGNYYSDTPFYKYNPVTDHWTALKSYPGPANHYYQALVTCNGEIFTGFSRNWEQPSNLYKYNIKSNTWIPCADLPLESGAATAVITVSIQNKINVFTRGTNLRWIYDPTLDSWSQTHSNVPDLIFDYRMFMFKGDYYFYRGMSGNALYKYNPSMGNFSTVNVDGLDSMTGLFTINDKCFCTSGCKIYELDLSTKSLILNLELSNYLYIDKFHFDFDSFFLEYNNTAYFLPAQNTVVSFKPGI